MWAVNVHVLWPFCTHTIPFRMLWCHWRFTITFFEKKYIYIYIYIYIFIRNVAKNMKTLWKVVQIVRYTWVLVAKDKSNHPEADSLRGVTQESWSWTTLSGKANDWRNRGHVVLNLFSNLKMGKIQKFLWWTSEARDNHTWANSGKQNWRWPPAPRVSVYV